MNRSDARRIAETITNDQLRQMFDNAKIGVKNWTETSICNLGFTKGVAWNILAKDFDVNHKYHILAKTNMVREFGEFLPDGLKPVKIKKTIKPPIHFDPIF
jgi:hypothetical protein